MQALTALKDQGNQFFKDKQYTQALETFDQGIQQIIQTQPQEQLTPQTEVGKLYVILNINAAFAALNLKTKEAYRKAELFCDVALSIDPKNQKGLYRRALANKELAQMLEIESQGSSEQLLGLYNTAKKALEDLIILDRTNQIAKQKLSEVVKNVYRVTVTQGKEINLTGTKVEEVRHIKEMKPESHLKVEEQKPAKKAGSDMNKILKQYRVDEVTMIAREKVQHQYLTQELPKTRAELEKAIREIEKSRKVFLEFIYRMTDPYLKEVKPTFDMLFQMVAVVLELGEGEPARTALQAMKSQKSFDLLWKSYTGGEKNIFREKCMALGMQTSFLK